MLHAQPAQVQFVHNASDVTLNLVDVYVNGLLYVNDMLYRSATAYLELPVAATTFTFSLAQSNATDATQAFLNQQVTVTPGQTYVAAIQGVRDPNIHVPNPDGRDIGISFLLLESKTTADDPETVELLFIHGMTDAQDVNLSSALPVALPQNLAYGTAEGYATIPAGNNAITLSINPKSSDLSFVGIFPINLTNFKGRTLTLLTSGFRDVFGNQHVVAEPRVLVVSAEQLEVSAPSRAETEITANVQIINNAPDARNDYKFDVLFDNGLVVNDLGFQRATPFTLVAGDRTIAVNVANSETGEIYASTPIAFEIGRTYILIINGVADPNAYAPNPSGASTGLTILVEDRARIGSTRDDVGQYLFLNGIPDAPAIDLLIANMGLIQEDVFYGELREYAELRGLLDMVLEVFPSRDEYPVLIRHAANTSFINSRSFVMFASGFLNPATNQDGPPASILLALDDGFVADLRDFLRPGLNSPRVQLIHASADPQAETLDIYFGNTRVADDLSFQGATTFFDVPTRTINVGLAPANSTSVADTITSAQVTFDLAQRYVAVAAGVLNEALYTPNPDSLPIGLSLFVETGAREVSTNPNTVQVRMFNAMTDAPAVTVTAERRDALGNVTFLSDNLPFGGFSSYDDLGLERHIFDFVPNDGSGRIGRTFADFSAPEATQIAVIVGTGFVTPTANQNGPGYDPIFVNSDGRTFPLGLTSTPIEDESPTEIPDQFVLQGNYPNPFNPSTRIIFDLPETALVSLDVFDVTGRKVRSVPTQPLAAGSGQSITLDADNLPSGLYLYQLTARGSNQTYIAQDQMMLVR